MAFKPIDPKRDEYRRYLERGGIIESLTKVFVRMLKERPENPNEYLLQNLGDARLAADHVAYLQNELDEARNEICRLTDIINSVNPGLLNTEINHPNNNNDDNNNNINGSNISKNNNHDRLYSSETEDNCDKCAVINCESTDNLP